MPVYMDTHHNVEGLTAEAVAAAHAKDLEVQDKYGVKYLRYWFDEGTGTTAADSSGNNNNATLLGSAGWTTGTVGPFALSESGIPGSYADISTDVVDTTKSFTVAAWVKLTTLPGYQTFVSEDGVNVGGNAQSAFFLQKRDDTQQFSFTVPYDFFTLPQSGFTPVVGTGTIWPGFTMRTHNPRLSMLTASWPT